MKSESKGAPFGAQKAVEENVKTQAELVTPLLKKEKEDGDGESWRKIKMRKQ